MKNIIKSTAYSITALSCVAVTNMNAAIDFGNGNVDEGLRGDGTNAAGDISGTIGAVVKYFLTFLALIAVILFIYAGFMILTAGGDEDKVKKGKTTMINALIGIFVIWISWTVVSWFIATLQASVVS